MNEARVSQPSRAAVAEVSPELQANRRDFNAGPDGVETDGDEQIALGLGFLAFLGVLFSHLIRSWWG